MHRCPKQIVEEGGSAVVHPKSWRRRLPSFIMIAWRCLFLSAVVGGQRPPRSGPKARRSKGRRDGARRLEDTTCADDIYLAPYMTGCPEGYDFPATEGACQRAADLSSGYEYGGAEGPYAEDHPPCFWDGDEEEFCWTRPARGYCPQISEEWGDLGAVCVRVGGCFETMGCQGGTL